MSRPRNDGRHAYSGTEILVLLYLLARHPEPGYGQQVRDHHELSKSAIYPAFKRLTERGDIEFTHRGAAGASYYRLTSVGLASLDTMINP